MVSRGRRCSAVPFCFGAFLDHVQGWLMRDGGPARVLIFGWRLKGGRDVIGGEVRHQAADRAHERGLAGSFTRLSLPQMTVGAIHEVNRSRLGGTP